MSKQVTVVHQCKLGTFYYRVTVTVALEMLHGCMRARRAGPKQPPLGQTRKATTK